MLKNFNTRHDIKEIVIKWSRCTVNLEGSMPLLVCLILLICYINRFSAHINAIAVNILSQQVIY